MKEIGETELLTIDNLFNRSRVKALGLDISGAISKITYQASGRTEEQKEPSAEVTISFSPDALIVALSEHSDEELTEAGKILIECIQEVRGTKVIAPLGSHVS